MADFKKDVKKIKKHAVPEEHEWGLDKEHSNKHKAKWGQGLKTGRRQ